MANINERIQQALTRHEIDVLRYEQGQVKEAVAHLNNLQAQLVNEIKRAEPRTKRQLEQLHDALDEAIDQTYRLLALESAAAFADYAVAESQAVSTISRRVFRAPIAPKLIGRDVALEIVETTLVPDTAKGTTLRERWARQRMGLKSNTKDGLNYAIENNQTLDDMLKIIRGNRALNYRDGVMFRSKVGAETVVRTATDTVTNAARLATYNRNSDVIEGIQANAVLDNRTTVLCRSRNGYAWRLKTGRPFRGTPIHFPGSPPWHFNCRTTLAPIFRSLKELQEVVDPELNAELGRMDATYSIDGRPAPTPSFAKTFDTMSKREQRRILGPGRLELYNEGKITLKDLLDQSGRELTLAELRERYSDD